jgi:hypothetical protein
MRWSRAFLVWAVLVSFAPPAAAGESLFKFERLRGIPTGGLAIREIAGGGVPWTLSRGEARLQPDGTLKVEVEGLVTTGVNPVSTFFATLSCQNADGITNNISTQTVPASSTGDARIEEVLTLPSVCLGPMVFVRSGGNGRWFAVSGF